MPPTAIVSISTAFAEIQEEVHGNENTGSTFYEVMGWGWDGDE